MLGRRETRMLFDEFTERSRFLKSQGEGDLCNALLWMVLQQRHGPAYHATGDDVRSGLSCHLSHYTVQMVHVHSQLIGILCWCAKHDGVGGSIDRELTV